ncbi:facilitated trehalose transporter Tret1-like [Epargyreus clarus]|uniref:facilitated trehalose transporter Tret1-like n=1 Tax=Epargyreus clarus TaxID=520877 RepID=UPI003C2F2E42
MEDCEYQQVNTGDQIYREKVPWKYFCRQILMTSAMWALYFNAGICVGAPTVLVPQLRNENNATVISDEMVTWLYSSFGFTAIPWVIIVPIFSTYAGRKLPYILSSVSTLATFLIFYFSTSLMHILISQLIQGFAHACNITITVLIVSEYVDSRYRGIFLTIKSASFFWGIWVANAIGAFCHWRYIALTGILSAVYSFIGILHPESPYWLASKGKYEKCRYAYRWLHGSSDSTEKELQSIIDSKMEDRKRIKNRSWSSVKLAIVNKQFYLPLALCLLMNFQYNFSGKLVCSAYVLDIVKKVTIDQTAAYIGMLILDGVTLIGMYIGSFVSKILKRRTLYFTSSFIGITFLFIFSLYLYLVRLQVLDESNTISILLLMVYSVSISCGPMILSMTITGEIIPMRFQAVCYSINSTIFAIVLTAMVKYAPAFFSGLGMDGSFLFYGVTSSVCTIVLYFYLPETKDKPLLEIEEYFKDSK